MATFTDFSNRYDQILRLSRDIVNNTNILAFDVNNGVGLDRISSRADEIDRQTDSAIDALNTLSEQIASSDLTPAQQESLQNVIDQTGNGLLDNQQRLVGIRNQARQNDQRRNLDETQPKNSAGDIVGNEQDARDNDANVQNPPQPELTLDDRGRVVAQPENVNTGTNARQPNTQDDTESNANDAPVGGTAVSNVGGDTPVKKTDQTQRTNNGEPGSAALDDDATTPVQSATATSTGSDGRPTVAKEYLEPIVPQPNLLSALSSMTYGISLYLMRPEDYAELVLAQDKIIPPTTQLLMQSGGIAKEERNQWFNVDFYIEDLQLESIVGTQGVGSPHNVVSLEFTVVEPNGITLLNRLNNAVIEYITGSEEETNAYAQTYLMVIRFYGYDAAGNAVTAADLGLPGTTDSNAVIEKFIPFMISNFTYKISTKNTEYRIKGVAHGSNIAFSTQRGVIPFNIQLSASSVNQLFNGNRVLAGDPDNSGTQTVVSGLVDALNQHQQELVSPKEPGKKQSYAIADEYRVVFQNEEIKNASVLLPGSVNKGRAVNQTAEQAALRYLQSQLNYDAKSKSYSVLAGTQIAQLLDLVLRTSSFITSQQNIIIDEKTGKTTTQANNKPMLWYRIKTQMEPLGYDTIRKTVAYRITYLISEYQINTPRSPYFPQSKYYGTHKLYNYWFTGLNTEVLDFEIDVNSNYFMVIGNDGEIDTANQGKFPVQQSYSSAPGQSLQGGSRNSTVPAANLSDRLYNIADVASAEIQIVGDPDWIQQSELIYNSSITTEVYCPDGSLNYDSREVLFELRFNPAQDYDLQTGLTNVYENNRDVDITNELNIAQESLVWSAVSVTSNFNDGKFTQRISGVIRDFSASIPPEPDDEVVTATTTSSTAGKVNTYNDRVVDSATTYNTEDTTRDD